MDKQNKKYEIQLYLLNKVKKWCDHGKTSKINLRGTTGIGENVALELPYALAQHRSYKHLKKCNADAARKLLERLKAAAAASDFWICMWILERRFHPDFGKC